MVKIFRPIAARGLDNSGVHLSYGSVRYLGISSTSPTPALCIEMRIQDQEMMKCRDTAAHFVTF